MGLWVNICRGVTVLACVLAGITLLQTLGGREISAIQQAAGAGMAVATAVIPYVFTRMFEGFLFQDADASPASDDFVLKLRHHDQFEDGWKYARPESPVLLVRDGGLWRAETETGIIGNIDEEGSRKLSFRTEALGKPRARITELYAHPERYVSIKVQFGKSAA